MRGLKRVRGWPVFLGLLALAVLAPFALFGASLEQWSVARLGAPVPAVALAALVLGLLAVDVFLPVPSSLVAVAAGHALGGAAGAAIVWAGLTLSCVLGYGLGRWLGAPGLRRLVGAAEAERAAARLQHRRGLLLLAASRAVPVASEVTVLVAGSLRLPWPWFVGVTSLANAGLAVVYATAGALSALPGHGLLAVLAGIALPALALLALPALARRTSGTRPDVTGRT